MMLVCNNACAHNDVAKVTLAWWLFDYVCRPTADAAHRMFTLDHVPSKNWLSKTILFDVHANAHNLWHVMLFCSSQSALLDDAIFKPGRQNILPTHCQMVADCLQFPFRVTLLKYDWRSIVFQPLKSPRKWLHSSPSSVLASIPITPDDVICTATFQPPRHMFFTGGTRKRLNDSDRYKNSF